MGKSRDRSQFVAAIVCGLLGLFFLALGNFVTTFFESRERTPVANDGHRLVLEQIEKITVAKPSLNGGRIALAKSSSMRRILP